MVHEILFEHDKLYSGADIHNSFAAEFPNNDTITHIYHDRHNHDYDHNDEEDDDDLNDEYLTVRFAHYTELVLLMDRDFNREQSYLFSQ
jgi:hypothetical protein